MDQTLTSIIQSLVSAHAQIAQLQAENQKLQEQLAAAQAGKEQATT